jgi:hypothetical protein
MEMEMKMESERERDKKGKRPESIKSHLQLAQPKKKVWFSVAGLNTLFPAQALLRFSFYCYCYFTLIVITRISFSLAKKTL